MLAAVAARRSSSMATEFGRAPAPAAAVAGLSAARRHRPSEVSLGTHMPHVHVPRMRIHHTPPTNPHQHNRDRPDASPISRLYLS